MELNTFNLSELTREMAAKYHYDANTIYGWFKTLMERLGIDHNELKNEKEEIWFYEAERPLLQGLLLEMGDGEYLRKLFSTKKKTSFSALDKQAIDFRNRMLALCDDVQDEELKEKWQSIVDALSQIQIRELMQQFAEKMSDIAKQLGTTEKYQEHIELLQELNDALVQWEEKHKN